MYDKQPLGRIRRQFGAKTSAVAMLAYGLLELREQIVVKFE